MNITLPRITSGFASVEVINEALAQIEDALNKALSTEESTANEMEVPLDMNSQRILNLPIAGSDNEPVTLGQLRQLAIPTIFEPGPHTQDWTTITGKPAIYPPTAHGHFINDVAGLQTTLDGLSTSIGLLNGRPKLWVQSTDPAPGVAVNDLWIF